MSLKFRNLNKLKTLPELVCAVIASKDLSLRGNLNLNLKIKIHETAARSLTFASTKFKALA